MRTNFEAASRATKRADHQQADLRPVDAIIEISAVSDRVAHVCGQKQNGRKGERASAR
jgi:hypothetical protein